MKKGFILGTCHLLFCLFPLLGDSAAYQNVDGLNCTFQVPSGSNIHEVVVVVDTNDVTIDSTSLSYELSHDGTSDPAVLSHNTNTNYVWDLSGEIGSPFAGTVHIETSVSSGVITLTFWVNPHVTAGSYGQFPSTQDWTFTVTGMTAGHNLDVITSASDISGVDVVLVSGIPVGAVDVDIEEPTVTLPPPGGILSISSAGEYLINSGGSIDFGLTNSDWENPIAGGQSFTWDFNGSGTALPAETVENPDPYVLDAVPVGDPNARYDISVTIRAAANGCIATDSCVLYVKNPPKAPSGIRILSPVTVPPHGDGPLFVNFNADVDHGDPFTEGDGDNDANATDYTLSWKVDGSEFDTGDSNDASPHTTNYNYTETGVQNVELTITDDYGLSSTYTSNDIYVTPIDNINFPPMAALPGEPGFPVIDGVLVPTDTDGDGILEGNGDDVIETGWHNAFRATFASGTDNPVAIQCLRPQNLTLSPYLYLSFEVNHDSAFDADDVIVLTFRPDRATPTPANDRRLSIFPVHDDAGAGEGAADGMHFNQAPQAVLYYQDSDSWSEITSGITEAATEADPGFYARVHSFEEGVDNYSWHVELRVPIEVAEGGANWVDLTDSFLFYANVIRVTDRTDTFGMEDYGTQFRWPREAPWAEGSLTAATNFPAWQWGGARRDSAFGDSTGVYFNSWSDIGIWDGFNILNTVNIDSDPFTIPMAARVHNNATGDIDNVKVLFRVAKWGATLLQDGNWTIIPETSPTTPYTNPTGSKPVPGGGDDLFHMNWDVTSGDGYYEHFRDVQDHQCVYAEIFAADGNIVRKSYWNNINFQVSSTVNDTARISAVGIGAPPENMEKHRVILEIVKQEWTEDREIDPKAMKAAEGLIAAPKRTGAYWKMVNGIETEEPTGTDSFLEYLVYAYYDTGDSLTINGNEYTMFEPIASFGYIFYHDDEVRKWLDGIENAEKISDTLYVIEIGEEDEVDIGLEIESKEYKGMSAGVHTGAAIPLDTLANTVGPGVSFFADFGWEMTSKISLNAILGYQHFFASNSGTADSYFINISANVRYFLRQNRSLRVFVGAGPGLYFPGNDIAFGFNAGLGVDFDLNRFLALEIGADYHYVQTSGGPSQFSTQHIGLIFRF